MRRSNLTGVIFSFLVFAALCVSFRQQRLADKTFVRAIMLEQTDNGYTVGLLFQDVAAAADASKAGETLALCTGEGQSLAQAFVKAEQQLPEQADYKLCEYTVACSGYEFAALQQYTAFLLQNSGQGRLSSCLYACESTVSQLIDAAEQNEGFAAEWLELLQRHQARTQRLYDAQSTGMLVLPLIRLNDGLPQSWCERSLLTGQDHTRIVLDSNASQLVWLLSSGITTARFLWQGEQIRLRRTALDYTVTESGAVTITVRGKLLQQTSMSQAVPQRLAEELFSVCGQALARVLKLDAYAQLYGGAAASASDVSVRFILE